MTYSEAVDWLRFQEDYTEKDICDILNSEGATAVIDEAIKLMNESEPA